MAEIGSLIIWQSYIKNAPLHANGMVIFRGKRRKIFSSFLKININEPVQRNQMNNNNKFHKGEKQAVYKTPSLSVNMRRSRLMTMGTAHFSTNGTESHFIIQIS